MNLNYLKKVNRLGELAEEYKSSRNVSLLEEIYLLLQEINENGQDANHLRILMGDLEKEKLKSRNVKEKQEEIDITLKSWINLYKKFDATKKPLYVGWKNFWLIFLLTILATVIGNSLDIKFLSWRLNTEVFQERSIVSALISTMVAISLLVSSFFQWWDITLGGHLIIRLWVKILFSVSVFLLISSLLILMIS